MWWPPPPFETTDARYTEIADAGFTFAVGGDYLNDPLINRRALDAARNAGLDFLPVDPTLTTLTHTFLADGTDRPFRLSDAEVGQGVGTALGEYAAAEAFAGLDLYDEPHPDRFATLGKFIAAAADQAPQSLPYVNLLPSDDPTYYRSFVREANPFLVSFDRYPLLLDGDDPNWFHNLAIAADAAREAGLPAWTFIQSIKYANHRMPTGPELRWQIGIALAYGYTGIQYFTYWTPDPARGEGFEPALITVDGRRTPLWDAAAEINPVLQHLGARILPLTRLAVGLTMVSEPPRGLPPFAADDWVAGAAGDPVVIGTFATDPSSHVRTLVVTNFSHDYPAEARLTLGSSVSSVTVEHGTARPRPRNPHRPVSLRLDAGEFALVTLERG